MTITLFANTDPKNKIGKNLTNGYVISGTLRNECNIENPVVRIESAVVPIALYNYMYIAEFNRYYFMQSPRAIRNGLWEITGTVDVLQSFAMELLTQEVILADTQETGADPYVNNDVYMTKVKTKTDIMTFPDGLLDDGEFILVTAGGLAV